MSQGEANLSEHRLGERARRFMVTLMIACLKIVTCKQLSPPKNEHPYIPTLDTTSKPGVPGPLAIDGGRKPKFGTLCLLPGIEGMIQ